MFPPVTHYEPLEIGSETRARAEKKARDRFEVDNDAELVRWAMSSKRGRALVWWLLKEAGIWHTSFSPNAMQMAFAEGNRNVGLKVLANIHIACPEMEATMRKENTSDRDDVDAGRTE